MFTLSFFLMCCLVLGTSALKAYDCQKPVSNITTLSLLEVAPCTTPLKNSTSTQEIYQITQLKSFGKIPARYCSLHLLLQTFYCGMHSHISLLTSPEKSFYYDLDYQQCSDLHRGFKVNVFDHPIMLPIGTNFHSLTVMLAGTIKSDGTCHGGSLTVGTTTFEDAVIEATITIRTGTLDGTLDIQRGSLVFPHGLLCQYKNLNCQDYTYGQLFWDHAEKYLRCSSESYDVIYEGLTDIITNVDHGITSQVISVNSGGTLLMLAINQPISICGQVAYKTEHPSIFLVRPIHGTPSNFFFKKDELLVENIDFATYVNTKFGLISKIWSRNLEDIYNSAFVSRCSQDRRFLLSQLSKARTSPIQFAYEYYQSPGHFGVVAGEVIHLYKCLPVEVSPSHGTKCYHEFPVLYQNSTYFVQPQTKILLPVGTEEPCNPLIPHMFSFGKQWIIRNPVISATHHPQVISPESPTPFPQIESLNIILDGLYPKQILDEWHSRLITGATMPAIIQAITIRISPHSGSGELNWDGLVLENQIKEVTTSMLKDALGFLWHISDIAGHIMGLLAILWGIRTIFETVFNTKLLYRQFGLSIKLIAGCWGSLTNYLVAKDQSVKDEKLNHELLEFTTQP